MNPCLPTGEAIRSKLNDDNNGAFKPAVNVVRSGSLGTITRLIGCATGREHGLMGRLESDVFHLIDFEDAVTNIMERYGHPTDWTVAVADDLGIRHPADPESGRPDTMSTDLVVARFIDGSTMFEAIDVQPVDRLHTVRALEKLELKRRLWAIAGIPYRIATDADLPTVAIENIRYVHALARSKDAPAVDPDMLPAVDQFLRRELVSLRTTLRSAGSRCEETFGLDPGTAINLARWFVATKRWRIDLSKPFQPSRSVVFAGN